MSAAWRAEQSATSAQRRGCTQEATFFAGQAEGLRAAAYIANPTHPLDLPIHHDPLPTQRPKATGAGPGSDISWVTRLTDLRSNLALLAR